MTTVVINGRKIYLENMTPSYYTYTSGNGPLFIMDDYSRQTLDRIAKNDKTLTTLLISPNGRNQHSNTKQIGYFDSTNSRTQFINLGLSIEKNSHLTTLIINTEIPNIGPDAYRVFYTGLYRNSSIKSLHIVGSEGWHGNCYAILETYGDRCGKNNQYLTSLRIRNVNLSINGANNIIHNTGLCANLETLKLTSCHITDEQLSPIVESMRHTSLKKLSLSNNNIQDVGCQALSTLLEDTTCSLQSLDLSSNIISNEGAAIVLNGLENNATLKKLLLVGNPIHYNAAEGTISRLLCNKSSLKSIYNSNHTLAILSLPDQTPPTNATNSLLKLNNDTLLKLNKDTNKRQVAMRKILRYQPNIDMEQLFELGSEGELSLKALPYVIAWFGRAMEVIISARKRGEYTVYLIFDRTELSIVCGRKLSAIYQFALAMPSLFATSRAKDELTKKSRVELESMNKVATDKCCVIM